MMNEDVVGGGAGISGVGQSLVLLVGELGFVARLFLQLVLDGLDQRCDPVFFNPTDWNLIRPSLPTTTQRGIDCVANLLKISRFGSAATAERPHPVNLVHPVLGENRRKLTDRMNRMHRIPGWGTKAVIFVPFGRLKLY
jgi:hypothetical protein